MHLSFRGRLNCACPFFGIRGRTMRRPVWSFGANVCALERERVPDCNGNDIIRLQSLLSMAKGSAVAADAYTSGVTTPVYETSQNVIHNTGKMSAIYYENIAKFINSSLEAFAVWRNGIFNSAYQTISGFGTTVSSGLQSIGGTMAFLG